jgi:hypothetical protein
MQERVRLIERVLALAGVQPLDARRPELPFGELVPRPRVQSTTAIPRDADPTRL